MSAKTDLIKKNNKRANCLKKIECGEISWDEIPDDFKRDSIFLKNAIIFNYRIFGQLPAEKAVMSEFIAAARVGAKIFVGETLKGIQEGKIEIPTTFDEEFFKSDVIDFINDKVRNSQIELGMPVEIGKCVEEENIKL